MAETKKAFLVKNKSFYGSHILPNTEKLGKKKKKNMKFLLRIFSFLSTQIYDVFFKFL